MQLPVVIDKNPHQEGFLDHHRVVFMPYSEDKNSLMALPSSPGLMFTTQVLLTVVVPVSHRNTWVNINELSDIPQAVSGGDIVIAVDHTLHKFWVVLINRTHQHDKV